MLVGPRDGTLADDSFCLSLAYAGDRAVTAARVLPHSRADQALHPGGASAGDSPTLALATDPGVGEITRGGVVRPGARQHHPDPGGRGPTADRRAHHGGRGDRPAGGPRADGTAARAGPAGRTAQPARRPAARGRPAL